MLQILFSYIYIYNMSFGSAIAAIVSQRKNRRKRTSQLERYAEKTGSKLGKLSDQDKLTATELNRLGQRIKAENNKKRQRVIALTAVIMIIVTSIFWYFMF